MKNLDKIIQTLEDLGFELEFWKNIDKQTIQDVVEEIKAEMLYQSYVDVYTNVEPNSIPKEFILFEKVINFYENFEFKNFESYKAYIDKLSKQVDKIDLPYIAIENNNSDFHYLCFIFPISD